MGCHSVISDLSDLVHPYSPKHACIVQISAYLPKLFPPPKMLFPNLVPLTNLYLSFKTQVNCHLLSVTIRDS
jgi:hypothetical protein